MKFGIEGSIYGAVAGIVIGITTAYYMWRVKRKREKEKEQRRE